MPRPITQAHCARNAIKTSLEVNETPPLSFVKQGLCFLTTFPTSEFIRSVGSRREGVGSCSNGLIPRQGEKRGSSSDCRTEGVTARDAVRYE
ncbi:Hypp2041 [Branchiostoma lanceolatum]|uniref:Hypp2041 protein n=1 Tax=Branchiostoma lanceolatum TaxID=7740 RepID=A0A8J9ZN62_BRALA|nr:Hypp2041 [Branchiostoma lanceolatum]